MSDWRQQIVGRFIPGLKPIFAVADPDDLLRDAAMQRMLEEKGFGILFYEHPIQFRLSYEQVFRARYDAGDSVSLVVVFSPGEHDFEILPMDVLEKAERVRLHLKEIFPKLSYNVLSTLPLSVMDEVFVAHEQHATQVLDEASSKDFILRHLYGVDASLVNSDSDLLRFLCRLHYRQMVLPDVLSGHLVARLSGRFPDWPMVQLLGNRAAFLGFLQERWPIFIRHTDGGRTLQEEPPKGFRYRGPVLLPFGHDDVRIFIDNFFEDGLLQPIEWSWNDAIAERWIRVGLKGGGQENNQLRLATLVEELGSAVPSASSQPTDWLPFAMRWSQARRLYLEAGTTDSAITSAYDDLRVQVDEAFHTWMWETYPRIHNYPTSSPVMVHHIPGFLSRNVRPEGNQKVALLVLDGLALDQWQVVREELATAMPGLEIQDSALFAWAPTVTPISRQAIFSGKAPLYFASSLFETSRDEFYWRQFWTEKGFSLTEIAHLGVSGEPDDVDKVADSLSDSIRILGMTVFKPDKIMHGMQLGSIGMPSQLRLWIQQGFLRSCIEELLSHGFIIFLTADHGNIDAVGVGTPKQGVLCDSRGERVRFFNEEHFAKACVAEVPGSEFWPCAGLPPGQSAVFAPRDAAFVSNGRKVVAHGAISIEETAVPFIKLTRSKIAS